MHISLLRVLLVRQPYIRLGTIAGQIRNTTMSSPRIGEKRELRPLDLQPATVDKKARLGSPSTSPNTQDTVACSNAVVISETSLAGRNASKNSQKTTKAAKRQRKKLLDVEIGSHDDVYWREIITLLGQEAVNAAVEEGTDLTSPFEHGEMVDFTISELSSNGEGLAVAAPSRRPWVVVIPLTLPGEKVRAKVYRHARMHSLASLVSVEEPNDTLRDESAVKCKYFGTCGGCQYQMISYDNQLQIKRNVVVRAYNTFSDLPSSSVPAILPTAPSPLQYGYRTKITPHFDAPSRVMKRANSKKPFGADTEGYRKVGFDELQLNIGFNKMGGKEVMDIEECPIATPILNEALGPLRENIRKNLHTYKKGVSLLLRDSLKIPSSPSKSEPSSSSAVIAPSVPSEEHVCVTDHKATVRERVGKMLFEYPGNQFFQNNNSVLIPLVTYVKDAIFLATSPASDATSDSPGTLAPTHLVDAYCGSGFFSIMLSPYFSSVAGIELSSDAIRFATSNAQLNNVPDGKCTFHAGDAAAIFESVRDFPPAHTAVIIDPPRKGCDQPFIDQLLGFRSATVVYVSCNVHTQARDIGMIVRKSEGDGLGRRYRLDSVRGFDLFPQTAHVESVAVLRLY